MTRARRQSAAGERALARAFLLAALVVAVSLLAAKPAYAKTFTTTLPAGEDRITATATGSGGTSEFSS